MVNPDNWPTGRSAVAVGTGDDHTCAILDDNSVSCWGRGNAGQLGQGSGGSYVPVTTNEFGGDNAKIAIDSHGAHSCVLVAVVVTLVAAHQYKLTHRILS